MAPKLRRRVDAEDIVQSAFRSFFAHAQEGDYQLADSGDLWRLLASITLHKLYGQVEKHTAGKRAMNREEQAEALAFNAAVAPEPTPAEIVAIVEQLHLVVDALSPIEQRALAASLRGETVAELAAALGKSERTARRLLGEVKRKMEARLLAPDPIDAPVNLSLIAPLATLQFTDYVLEQLLGAGGMGKVYRAREKHTGKTVAIKALHKSRQADRRAVARFLQEAEIVAKLNHPHIVGVRGMGQFPSGGYFLAMDFVDGADLEVRLQQSSLAVGEAAQVGRQVASAVQYAHERGVVHCDLKPGNVLIDARGQALVTDFGFAYLIAGGDSLAAHHIGGTTGYIAPEILSGRSPPTPATDIYALGMLLWTLTTGRPPEEYCELDTVNEAAGKLFAICRRCLAGDPAARYRSAAEMSRELERLD